MNAGLNNSIFELSVKGLTIIYSNGHKALFNANCQLKSGTICALLGANGSGKSTLFKSIMGVIKYQQGEISLNQKPIKESLKKSLIAYVPQSEDIDWNFPVSVNDVVMMGRYGYMNFLRLPSMRDKIAVRDSLERLTITHLADRQIGELSGGQRKRVFLARALAQEARILLLDEPFTGIDTQTELAIIDLLKQLRDEGCLVLISTHNLSAVPQFADEVILVNRTIVAAGPMKKIFTLENLQNAFGNKNIGLSGLFS